MKEKVVFACGGTLGHILPAVSIAHLLKEKKKNIEIIFIMTKKDQKYDFIKNDVLIDSIYYYDIDGLDRKNLIRNISNIFKIFKACKFIKEILLDASLVIGMGGYISAVVLKIAKKLAKLIIIHEQNAIMGLANKLVYKDADLILSAFPLEKIKSVVIGNPRLDEAAKYLKNKKKTNQILVTSGSLGSAFINNLIARWLKTEESKKYYTTLITGKKYYEEVKNSLNNMGNHFEIIPFVDNLLEYLSTTNLVISRSGATTIFEIIGLNIPSIMIPSPNVTNDHQYYNALFLKQKEACVLLKEEEIKIEIFNQYIEYAINNPVLIDNLKKIRAEYQKKDLFEVINNVRK